MGRHDASSTLRDHRKQGRKRARKEAAGFAPVANAEARTVVQWFARCGASNPQIEAATKLTHDFVWRWSGREDTVIQAGRGRKPLIDDDTARKMVKAVVKVRFASVRTARDTVVDTVSGKPFSESAVRSALKREGLISKRVKKGQILTREQRDRRIAWCKEHLTAKSQFRDWVWSDEKWWCVGGVQGNERMWVFEEDPFPDELFVPTAAHPIKVHIWAAISYDGRSSIHVHDGKITSKVYCECLNEAFIPCLYEPDYLALDKKKTYVFMQDGASCHTSAETYKWLTANLPSGIRHHKKGEWPASSPDLNPIERLWSILQDRVIEQRAYTYEKLVDVVTTVWWELEQSTIRKLYDSMPTRCQKCVNAEGGRFRV